MKQRFYVMIDSKKTIEPKDVVIAISEARPEWVVSSSLAAQQSVQPTPSKTPPDYHKGDWIGNVYLGSE